MYALKQNECENDFLSVKLKFNFCFGITVWFNGISTFVSYLMPYRKTVVIFILFIAFPKVIDLANYDVVVKYVSR